MRKCVGRIWRRRFALPPGQELENIEYRDTYRDAKRLGQGKKSQLLTIILRRGDGTLTNAEADQVRDRDCGGVRQSARGDVAGVKRRRGENEKRRVLVSAKLLAE